MKRFFSIFVMSGALAFFAPAAHAATPLINCASGFASTGVCGVGDGQNFWTGGSVPTDSQLDFIPTGTTHGAGHLIYQTLVNVQAFSAAFTFVPNGQNVAFLIQNSNNDPGYNGARFSGGAGCEGGFFQAFGANAPPNNIFALELDSYSPLTLGGSFTYSSAQIYHAGESPCLPNDAGNNYPTKNKISTSPVPLNSPPGSQNTTTGHTYSATVLYDGSNLTLNLFDVTAGGSCPGASCFTQTWTGVNVPSNAGGNTAYVGLVGATGLTSTNPLFIKSFVYSAGSGSAPSNSCDLNNDGAVNAADVQSSVNQALGIATCGTADLQSNGQCTAVDVQRVVNAALGGQCVRGL